MLSKTYTLNPKKKIKTLDLLPKFFGKTNTETRALNTQATVPNNAPEATITLPSFTITLQSLTGEILSGMSAIRDDAAT